MNNPDILKNIWRISGIAGIAVISWCFWEIQTQEHVLRDMIWLLLCGMVLMASACCFYLAWEKVSLLETLKKEERRSRQNCDGQSNDSPKQ